MATIGVLLMVAGYGTTLVCGIWMLVIAFQEGVVQGLLYLFVPFYAIYYLITRWEQCKKPFLYSLAGVGVAIVGVLIAGAGAGGA